MATSMQLQRSRVLLFTIRPYSSLDTVLSKFGSTRNDTADSDDAMRFHACFASDDACGSMKFH